MYNPDNVFAVILAGGSGTRFWPVSRQARPKQFLALSNSDESLIQATARRISPLLSSSNQDSLMVVSNHELGSQVRYHVPQAVLISEPIARNTAASIALAALHIYSKDPSGIMIVLPADHSVSDEQTLREVLGCAIESASQNSALVTIGIKPESPNTAYGYIKRGEQVSTAAYRVKRFFEKPNLDRAIEYCNSGDFYWNSGMFVWKAAVILEAFSRYMPRLSEAIGRIAKDLGSSRESETVRSEFEKLDSVSIDFGVLEHADNCMVVEARQFGWNDVGSWDAWAEHFTPDSDGNVLSGDVISVQSDSCIALSKSGGGRALALLGVSNLVVVDTSDALLVCNRSNVQDVKLVVEALKKLGRTDLL